MSPPPNESSTESAVARRVCKNRFKKRTRDVACSPIKSNEIGLIIQQMYDCSTKKKRLAKELRKINKDLHQTVTELAALVDAPFDELDSSDEPAKDIQPKRK